MFSKSAAQPGHVSSPLPTKDAATSADANHAPPAPLLEETKDSLDPTLKATRFAVRSRGLEKPYKLDRRGFRPTGNGSKGRCPHCGKSISHGLPGNPYTRKFQPCQRTEVAAELARRANTRRIPPAVALEEEEEVAA